MRYALTLDLAKPDDVRTIKIRKGEIGSVTLAIVVNEDGEKVDLTQYTAVRFCASKPDGVVFEKVSVIEDGTATYTLPASLASVRGKISVAYVMLEKEGYIGTTQCVCFDVLDAVPTAQAEAVYVPEFEELKGKLDDYVVQYAETFKAIEKAEADRATAEQGRASAETARTEAEAARAQAEEARSSAESAREAAESKRSAAESKRASEEQKRATAESGRVQAESNRSSAEGTRSAAETARAEAEAKRKAEFADMISAAQGTKLHICADGEFGTNGVPTLAGSPGIIYLVPFGKQGENDRYAEWLYVNGKWEKMGITGSSFDPISTDTIDVIAGGATKAGDEVVNTTGLSYFFTKLGGIFSRIGHKHGKADITDLADWAKADSKPSYEYSEISGKPTTFTPSIHTHSAEDVAAGILPIKRGGTGAATAPEALKSLGITVGTGEPPATGTPGSIYIKLGVGAMISGSSTPIGTITAYGGSTAPSGWLLCDGSEVSRVEYSLLFDAIGTAYGDGDGSTTFNLPSMAGRAAIGSSASHVLGTAGGEEAHALTASELPKDYASIFARLNSLNVPNVYPRSGATHKTESGDYTPLSLSGNTGTDIDVITFSGDGKAFNVMQPYLAVNYIIYAGR